MDNRLKMVASLVPTSETIADIGTDHALLAIYLIKKGIAKRVIASDVKLAPLKVGQENVIKNGAADFIELRLSFGFNEYKKGEFSAAVIAGMGGETIADIIKSCPFLLDVPLVLQPMSCCDRLIEFLNNNGFEILKHEAVLSQKRIYNVLLCIKNGTKETDPIFNIVGKLDINNPLARQVLTKKLKSLKKAINGLLNADKKEELTKLKIMAEELEKRLLSNS